MGSRRKMLFSDSEEEEPVVPAAASTVATPPGAQQQLPPDDPGVEEQVPGSPEAKRRRLLVDAWPPREIEASSSSAAFPPPDPPNRGGSVMIRPRAGLSTSASLPEMLAEGGSEGAASSSSASSGLAAGHRPARRLVRVASDGRLFRPPTAGGERGPLHQPLNINDALPANAGGGMQQHQQLLLAQQQRARQQAFAERQQMKGKGSTSGGALHPTNVFRHSAQEQQLPHPSQQSRRAVGPPQPPVVQGRILKNNGLNRASKKDPRGGGGRRAVDPEEDEFSPAEDDSESDSEYQEDYSDRKHERQQVKEARFKLEWRQGVADMRATATALVNQLKTTFAENGTQAAAMRVQKCVRNGRTTLVDNFRDTLIAEGKAPECYSRLKNYQRVGIRWLDLLSEGGYGGGRLEWIIVSPQPRQELRPRRRRTTDENVVARDTKPSIFQVHSC